MPIASAISHLADQNSSSPLHRPNEFLIREKSLFNLQNLLYKIHKNPFLRKIHVLQSTYIRNYTEPEQRTNQKVNYSTDPWYDAIHKITEARATNDAEFI